MSDTSTTQPLSYSTDHDGHRPGTATASLEADGHGRHRGPVAARDGDGAPSGRHRRPGGAAGAKDA